MKLLVAFDFDHTIIHFNSDIVVEHLLPNVAFTENLKRLKEGPLWIDYMQGVFNALHERNVTKEKILEACEACESTEGMVDFIKSLKGEFSAQIIIISDSNTVFIKHWLKCKNIYHLVDKIYTNPGEFDSKGLLRVQMYHNQDWCSLSTRNLCKGFVLEQHLEQEKKMGNRFDIVAYVGDGRNDLCPLLKLRVVDHCFPRINYTLDKILKSDEEVRSQVKASVHPWDKASDIMDVLNKCCA